MRSESRTGPRAMAAVIFSFCFFEMLVFVLRAADRHTLAAQRSAGKHPHAHAGVCSRRMDATYAPNQAPTERYCCGTPFVCLIDKFRPFGQVPYGLPLARFGHKVHTTFIGLLLGVPGALPAVLFRCPGLPTCSLPSLCCASSTLNWTCQST